MQRIGNEGARAREQAHEVVRRWLRIMGFAMSLATGACGADIADEPESPEGRTVAAKESQVALASLLEEMASLSLLAQPSPLPFQTAMASSYDRASLSADEPGWFANVDRGQYLREDGAEHVLMESSGPGVITRIWSPNPSGTLRVYLDDITTPVLEAPMADLLSGAVPPFEPPFASSSARGNNLFFPIAYQRHARVTATGDELYYQIDHRSYEPGTSVERFDPRNIVGSAEQVYRAAADDLKQPGQGRLNKRMELDSSLPAWQALDSGRAGSLTELQLTPARTDEASLRGTILEMRFDGVQTVRVPLGDFFGTGPGLNTHRSLAFEVDAERGTLRVRFVMPYGNSAELRLSRGTADALQVKVSARVEARDEAAPMLYFHAGWTGPLTFDAEQPRDLTLFELDGSGHYVGLVLNVANPDPQWWGEGDEKIYVDGQTFPGYFGTGTEDYFGYGWCSTELFSSTFSGQTRANQTDNAGHVSLYRLLLLDRIPFTTSLRFDLEALHWATGHRSVSMTYDAVYFWYGDSAASDRAPPLPDQSFQVPQLPAGTVQVSDEAPVSC